MKNLTSTRIVAGAWVPSSRPGAKRLLWRTALVLALASGSVMAQPVVTQKLAGPVSASVLAEIGQKGQALGLTRQQLDGLLTNLRSMDMQQLRDLGELRNQSQLERLVPGATAGAGARAAVDPSRPGTQGAGNTGGASQQGVTGALRPGGQLSGTGRLGQLSSCYACDGSFGSGGQSGQSTNPDSKSKTVTTSNGGSIDIHNDGSAKITNANGKVEYINSEQRIVDRNNNAATPNPDRDASSNRVYAHDLAAVQARLGSNRTPNPNSGDNGGVGGGLSGNSNAVGTRATFIDTPTAARFSVAALAETIRIAVERVAGPKVGKP